VSVIANGEFRVPHLHTILFGRGSIQRIGEQVDELGGRRALVVTVPKLAGGSDPVDRIKAALGGRFAGIYGGVIQHSPRESVVAGAKLARMLDADTLVSLGGGSATDTTKGINILLSERIDMDAFLAGKCGAPLRVQYEKLPHLAVTTTLSAAEFSDRVGIMDTPRKEKDSVVDARLVPKVVIMDPEMTTSTPPALWASGCLKCLTDLFEQFCSPRHHPFVDALALDAIRIVYRYLIPSMGEPPDLEARGMLQQVPLMGHFGARSVGLGLAAALRHQIGPMYDVAHGVISAIVFPHCVSFNRPLVDERLTLVAQALDIAPPRPEAVLNAIRELIREAGLPTRLRDVGIPREGFTAMAEAAMGDFALATNPKQVRNVAEIIELLEQAW
jgi:alcohol dehydrogenase class IV